MRPDRPQHRLGAEQLAHVVSVVGGGGVDAADRTSLLQWAAIGLTDLCWRHTTWVARWHASRGGPLDDAAMLQVGVATTRIVHTALVGALDASAAGAAHDLGEGDDDAAETAALTRAFTEVLDAVYDPQRVLPDGTVLGALAAGASEAGDDPEALRALRLYAELQLLSVAAVAERGNVDVALLVLAVPARQHRATRWGTPGWPLVVDVVLRRLDDPYAELWEHPAAQPVPHEVADRERLRRLLVHAPDQLQPDTVRFLLDAVDLGSLTADG